MKRLLLFAIMLFCSSLFAEAEKPPAPPPGWGDDTPAKPAPLKPQKTQKVEAPKPAERTDDKEQHTEDPDNKMIVYDVRPDEFSSKQRRRLMIGDSNGGKTVLVITEIDSKVEIGIHTADTLFPNETDSSLSKMMIAITFKFDTQKEADQSSWTMNIMKYHDAWYEGDATAYLKEMFQAGKLSLKTDKRGDIYRFDLTGIAKYKEKF